MIEMLLGPNANKSKSCLTIRMGIATALLFAIVVLSCELLGLESYWMGAWFLVGAPVVIWDCLAEHWDAKAGRKD